MYPGIMSSESAIERMRDIRGRVEILYGLDNLNPIIRDLLNDVCTDVDWLCDRLWSAWATVEAYQNELRGLHDDY